MVTNPQPTNLPAGPQPTRLFRNGNMSAITLGELEAGFAKSTTPDAARQQAAAVFQAVTVVPFDEAAARAFGRVQSEAPARRGAYDRQIAAHAISLGLTVVTNNEQDFEGIPSLDTENWTSQRETGS